MGRRVSIESDDGTGITWTTGQRATPIDRQLRQIVSITGAPLDAAAGLLTTADGTVVHDFLLASLLNTGGLLSEIEALTALVRLLSVGTGDPNGDAVTRDFLDPCASELELSVTPVARSGVVQMLRSQTILRAILDVLERHSEEFDRGDSVYLRWEALKALRLVMTPPGLLYVGAATHTEATPLWPEDDHGYFRNGNAQRQLVEVLLHHLRSVGDVMGQKLKIAVLGCLWSLATTSSYIRTRVLQSGGEALVASAFHAQVNQPGLFVEAALVVECGVLVTLAGGSRMHERTMAKLGVDLDVVEMLRKFKDYREVACAGLVLLALLANDETVAARLTASPDSLAVVSAARARWPEEAAKALKNNVHYVSPTATTLITGSPPVSSRRQKEVTRGAQARNRSARNRSVRAAALCVVGVQRMM